MNSLNIFRKVRKSKTHPNAHMTWASKSIGSAVSRTSFFLRRQLWIWPIIAVVVLSALGFAVRGAIESTMKKNLASELKTLCDVETAMLAMWYKTQSSNAVSLANDQRVREVVYQLVESGQASQSQERATPDISQVVKQLEKELAPVLSSHAYSGYFITDKEKRILASSHAELIGQQEIPEHDRFLTTALDGETVVCPPFPSVVMVKNEQRQIRIGEPVMYVCAPVRDTNFQVVATLALQIRPQLEFTRILQLGRLGNSGETYAINKSGVMVSGSRFDEDLILLGLLPDQEHSRSILNVLVRAPDGDITQGYRATQRRSQLPLTRMAKDALAGNSNVDVEGYRDYRGVPVVGAWKWLPDQGIGVATEMDVAEAFRPLTILQRTFWGLYALLILSSIAIFIFTVIVARLRREAQKAAIESQQLGQYTLEEKLGAGAMGVVYKGHHAMLRRPTAIKMLGANTVDDASLQRFEREVQITCQLNHPNTIAIYDYGRTPEGVFYYAMEYLDGIDLQTLVEENGPQPESRVIHLLIQICGSLYEAHSEGMVHRDIKPANIMLNRRGCEPDVIKVLDFGLVKAIEEEKQSNQSSAGSLTGTPLYMSPEAIQTPMSVDGRNDIYAVGAVGYFLLTGRPVFEADDLVDLCQQHVDAVPPSPSERLGRPISADLENALLSCLEKSRAKRPQTARDLEEILRKCSSAGKWTAEEGDSWWGRHERGQRQSPNASQKTTASNLDQTIFFGNEAE